MKKNWQGIALMIAIAGVIGMGNVMLSAYVTNNLTSGAKGDEVAVNTFVLNLFVGWIFLSAWLLTRADEEWKKVQAAVHSEDEETFLVEAPKKIALSVQVVYWIISVLTVVSFHLFHFESFLVLFSVHFGVGFLVAIMSQVLLDLDDPLSGIINVEGVPDEWLKKLKKT